VAATGASGGRLSAAVLVAGAGNATTGSPDGEGKAASATGTAAGS